MPALSIRQMDERTFKWLQASIEQQNTLYLSPHLPEVFCEYLKDNFCCVIIQFHVKLFDCRNFAKVKHCIGVITCSKDVNWIPRWASQVAHKTLGANVSRVKLFFVKINSVFTVFSTFEPIQVRCWSSGFGQVCPGPHQEGQDHRGA